MYLLYFFFFNDTATTEIYTLSLHDALPICCRRGVARFTCRRASASFTTITCDRTASPRVIVVKEAERSEEHTSELQSRLHLVCRLLLEKKKKKTKKTIPTMR